jgi:purine-binding chemotaxis protein CheW
MQTNHHKKPKKQAFCAASDFMPCSKKSKAILHARAELIANNLIETIDESEKANYIRFYLGQNEQYGIDYIYIKEVVDKVMITKLPCAPHFIAGIINRRGALLPIIDLKKLFFNEPAGSINADNIIIVSANNITMGFLADRIEGNTRYNEHSLHEPLLSETITNIEFIVGLHQAKTAMINVDAVISYLQRHLSKNDIMPKEKQS